MVNQRSLVDNGMVDLRDIRRGYNTLDRCHQYTDTDWCVVYGSVVDGRVVHCVVDWAVQGRVADTQVPLQPLVVIVRSVVHLLKHCGPMDE